MHLLRRRRVGAFAIASFARAPDGGLFVPPDSTTILQRDLIIELAARHRLPAVYTASYFVAAGGLMSYGATLSELFRRSAWYVHRILHGAKPAELPIEQPTKFELTINLKTARALRLTIPPALLARANEVIE